MCHKLSAKVIDIWKPSSLFDTSVCPGDSRDLEGCSTCFGDRIHKPLNLKSFQLLREWQLDVPLVAQIVLESFINLDTLRRCKDADGHLKSKLERLYTTYDALLNISNRHYSGLFQQANTDELLMHFKSVNSVFAVTSSSGATRSLTTAERSLKTRAVDDTCYFQTYLKEHTLNYKRDNSSVGTSVNLRNCHIVFMLDNLVCLKFGNDPNPGESRSKQICALLITIQGLPKDADELRTWHDQAICDGTVNCLCKEGISLCKTDIPAITVLTGEEHKYLHQFQQMCVWGHLSMWASIKDSKLKA